MKRFETADRKKNRYVA